MNAIVRFATCAGAALLVLAPHGFTAERTATPADPSRTSRGQPVRPALVDDASGRFDAIARFGFRAPGDDAFYARDAKLEALGRLLFHDKLLSGNRNISCSTCHHAFTATTDGLALPIGEGGAGLSVARSSVAGDHVYERVPRNSPALWNLGAREFETMFHDGRVARNDRHASGFDSPAGDNLPQGLANALAAQAMFPVTSGTEMAGQAGENPIADAAASGDLPGVWALLAARLNDPANGYVDRFIDAFDDVGQAGEISFVHAANAIAAFEAAAWRATDSPFDRYLRGDRKALSKNAEQGAKLFYGAANCSSCHAGPFQTDHRFYAIGVPQIGPGKGDGFDGHEDFGRERVSGDPDDRYRFRTPSLRNVALTGPYGHDGAHRELEDVVRHHLDALSSLHGYDTADAVLPPDPELDPYDFMVQHDPGRVAEIATRIEIAPVSLSDEEVSRILDFLDALTDPASVDTRLDQPMSLPSGLSAID